MTANNLTVKYWKSSPQIDKHIYITTNFIFVKKVLARKPREEKQFKKMEIRKKNYLHMIWFYIENILRNMEIIRIE